MLPRNSYRHNRRRNNDVQMSVVSAILLSMDKLGGTLLSIIDNIGLTLFGQTRMSAIRIFVARNKIKSNTVAVSLLWALGTQIYAVQANVATTKQLTQAENKIDALTSKLAETKLELREATDQVTTDVSNAFANTLENAPDFDKITELQKRAKSPPKEAGFVRLNIESTGPILTTAGVIDVPECEYKEWSECIDSAYDFGDGTVLLISSWLANKYKGIYSYDFNLIRKDAPPKQIIGSSGIYVNPMTSDWTIDLEILVNWLGGSYQTKAAICRYSINYETKELEKTLLIGLEDDDNYSVDVCNDIEL